MITALLEPVCGSPQGDDISRFPGAFLDPAGSGQWCLDTAALPPDAVTVTPPVWDVPIVDFITDPLGFIAQQVVKGAVTLLGFVAKWAVASTQPDLTTDWWREAYARSFAVGTVLFGFVLIIQLARSRKGNGHDFITDTSGWVVAYFFGVFIGPPLAQMLINGFAMLSKNIIEKWGGTTPDEGFKGILDAAIGLVTNRSGIEAVLAIVFGFGLLLAAIAMFISMSLQMMVLYLAGAVFPIAFVWVISRKHRQGSFKIPAICIGILASQPTMFFLMGMGFSILHSAIFGSVFDGDVGRYLATIIMAISIFLITAFTPVLLLKFAPIVPTGTTDATSTAGGGGDVPRSGPAAGGKSGGGKSGGSSSSATQTASNSRRPAPSPGGSVANAAGGRGSGGGAPGNSSAGGSNPTAAQAASTGGSGTPGRGSSAGGSNGSTTGAGSGSGSTGVPNGTGGSGGSSSGSGSRFRPKAGGPASTALGKLTALAPHAAKGAAAVSAVSGAAARGRRRAHNLNKGSNGDQPWS